MDTYENMKPEDQSESEQQPLEQSPAEHPSVEEPSSEQLPLEQQGFYHGEGVGFVEATGAPDAPETADTSDTQAGEPVFGQPPEGPVRPTAEEKPHKKGVWKKLGRRMTAGALVLALVAAGTIGSAVLMNGYWKYQNKVLQRSFNERIAVLEQQLEAYRSQKAEQIVIPVEGMTPTQIYDENISSVVAINCVTQAVTNGQSYGTGSAGSGFILTADGYVVTNHHVVDGATTIYVVKDTGERLEATLIGSDQVNDIALLKVEAENLRPVNIGSSSALKVGDQVVAIGNALGELSFSLTVGYVSGMDRDVSTEGTVQTMIQTDASINSGNSGGPLFNAKGEVIGITSAKYSGTTSSGASIEGIGFAIPMDDVYGMLEDLREYGYIKSVYLGVMVQDVDAMSHQVYGIPLGAYVKSVTFGGSAFRAGIQAQDIIIRVGGYSVESLSDLTRALRNFEPGQEATITVWRAGVEKVLTIVFDEKPRS